MKGRTSKIAFSVFIIVITMYVLLIYNTLITSASEPLKTPEQYKSQISLFQEALGCLGACSPEEAAELWAKGEMNRNGALQYAVSCGDLKNSLQNTLGSPQSNIWVIGVSSPWVTNYYIEDKKALTKDRYKILIKYSWATSSGPEPDSYIILSIIKENNHWCVKKTEAATY